MVNQDFSEYVPTWKEWLTLKKLSTCKNTKKTFKKDWADRAGLDSHNPIFIKVMSEIERLGISQTEPWISNYKVVSINIKKLDLFIESTDIYHEFRNYVRSKELIVVGV